MKKALKDVWRNSGGDIGKLAVTGKSGADRELNRKGQVPSGSYDARDRKVVKGRGNEAFQNSAADGELSRLVPNAEKRGDEHSLRTSGGATEQSDLQASLPGSPFPKPGKLRKGLSRRNASQIRSAPRIPGAGEPPDKSEQMSSAMRAELRQAAEDPQE